MVLVCEILNAALILFPFRGVPCLLIYSMMKIKLSLPKALLAEYPSH